MIVTFSRVSRVRIQLCGHFESICCDGAVLHCIILYTFCFFLCPAPPPPLCLGYTQTSVTILKASVFTTEKEIDESADSSIVKIVICCRHN